MIQKNVGDAWIYLTFLFYIIPQCHILFHLSDAELLGTFVGEQSPHVSPAWRPQLTDSDGALAQHRWAGPLACSCSTPCSTSP